MPRSEAEEVRAHVEAFRQAYVEFPAGEVRTGADGVEPDIIVAGDRVVGIEHTRFVRTDAAGVPVLRIQEGERESVARETRRLFQRRHSEPVHVSIHWSAHESITKSRRLPLARALADRMLLAMVESTEGTIRLDYYDGLGQADLREVDTVRIYRSTPLLGSHWGLPDSGYVPDLCPEAIQAILDRKNTKPKNYHMQYDALWLLIVADGSISSLFKLPPATRVHRYRSQFDRIVFFDWVKKEPTELPKV